MWHDSFVRATRLILFRWRYSIIWKWNFQNMIEWWPENLSLFQKKKSSLSLWRGFLLKYSNCRISGRDVFPCIFQIRTMCLCFYMRAHSHVLHDSFICVTWLIHSRLFLPGVIDNVNETCVCLYIYKNVDCKGDTFTYVMMTMLWFRQLKHECVMTHSYVCVTRLFDMLEYSLLQNLGNIVSCKIRI